MLRLQKQLLSFLDHLWKIGLREDFGDSKNHQSIFGIDKIGPHSSVQKHLEKLGVHQQVLLDK